MVTIASCCHPDFDPRARGDALQRILAFSLLLTDPDNTGQPQCELCETWSTSADGKTLIFNLRRDVYFHDGRQLTAADVKYSLALSMGLIDGVRAGWGGALADYMDFTKGDKTYTGPNGSNDGITTPDQWTVELHLKEPSRIAPLMLLFVGNVIIPAGTTMEQQQNKPIGTGPFMVDRVTENEIHYVRNPNYFKKGKPYLDRVRVLFQPDADVSVINFLNGQLDVVSPAGGLPPGFRDRVERVAAQGEVQLERFPPLSSPGRALFLNTSRPPFDDIRVRQAVNLAVDRVAQNRILFDGEGVPALPLSFAGPPYARPESEIWNVLPGWGTGENKAREIEQAKALLAQVYPNGYPETIEIVAYNFLPTQRLAEFFAGELSKLGFRTEVVLKDSANTVTDFRRGLHHAWAHWLGTNGADPDFGWTLSYLKTAPRSFGRLTDPEFHRLYDEQKSETDLQRRAQLNRQMEDILLRELVNIDGMDAGGVQLVWNHVKNYGIDNALPTRHGNLENVWLDK